MARVRFKGPEAHDVPLLGRTVEPDELVGMPGEVIEQVDGGWLCGDPADPDGQYLLPATNWAVEDEPKARRKPATTKDEV
jgi:hypothetical protein